MKGSKRVDWSRVIFMPNHHRSMSSGVSNKLTSTILMCLTVMIPRERYRSTVMIPRERYRSKKNEQQNAPIDACGNVQNYL